MIRSVAFCPSAPLLVDGVGGEASAELDEFRSACDQAVADAVLGVKRVVIVGSADASARFVAGAVGTLASFGIRLDVRLGTAAPQEFASLPLSLTIGAWLLSRSDFAGEVCAHAVAQSSSTHDCEMLGAELASGSTSTALIVIGDGSARRSEKAPGYVDERAHQFDADISQALALGDCAKLLAIDAEVANDLLVAGRAPWQVAASAVGDAEGWKTEVLASVDPYGVAYFAAEWLASAS